MLYVLIFKHLLHSYLYGLHETKGAFHLSELTGQTLLVVTRISLLIKTIQPDQSNPKYYARKRWFFSKNSWEKPISLLK